LPEEGKNATKDSDGRISVFLIGEAGGGLIWFSKDNFVGLYHILKERISKKDAPDAIVFHGEILPVLPKYITKGGYSESRPLQEHINSLDLAVVQIKPHLARIAKLAKESGTEIYYVFGPSDRGNISREHDMLVRIYTNSPEEILKLIKNTREKIQANEKIIETTENVLKKELAKSGNQNANKIENMKEKIRQLKEEAADFEELEQLYTELIKLWLDEHPDLEDQKKMLNPTNDKETDRLIGKIKTADIEKKIEELTKELEKTDKDKEPEKYRQLDEQIKSLNNELKRGTYEELREAKREAEKKVYEKEKFGELYTGHYAGSKSLDSLAFEIAKKYIELNIRNAFGRRTEVKILDKLANDIEIKGRAFRVSDLPAEGSREYLLPQNYFKPLLHDLEKTTIVTVAHTTQYHVETVAPYNAVRRTTGVVYEIAVPPIIDSEKVRNAWEAGVNTPLTKAIKKLGKGITTGFVEVTFKGENIATVYYSEEYLRWEAIKEYETQRHILDKKLKTNGNGISELTARDEDKLQIYNKLPEEMNKRLVKIAKARYPDALNLPNKTEKYVEKMEILMVNDTHIGTSGYGIPTFRLLSVLPKKLKEIKAKPELLFFGGDNIEATYKNIKYEQYEETNREIPDELKGALRTKYKAWQYERDPISSTNAQIKKFVEYVEPLLEGTRMIILVSGQHTNKTYLDKTIDEANAIKEVMLPIAEKHGIDKSNVVAVSGGDKGVGEVKIEGEMDIFAAHSLPKNLRFSKGTIFALGADKHQHIAEVEADLGGHLVAKITGAASTPITHFVNQVGITTSQSLRGFTFVRSMYEKDTHKLLTLETRFISLDDLMPLIRKEMEKEFGKEDLKMLERIDEERTTLKRKNNSS